MDIALAKDYPNFTEHGTPPCAEADPEAFFPDRNGLVGPLEIKLAKRICQPCPYRVECLEWALSNREIGIWGGTTELDRKRMRRVKRQHAS